MAANTLSYNAIGLLLNQIVSEATGQAVITPADGNDFISVANTGLLAGYDNLMGAISQVLSRTIIANRPYSRKFKGLEADSIRWGNMVRKINYVDRDWDDGGRLPITNGVAVDDQKPVLDDVLQTNFYSQNDYEIQWTLYANQLDVAFQGPDEFGAFISGKLQNISDMVEQKNEALARGCIQNLIAGVYEIGNTTQIVHLLTEYNTLTGNSYTKQQIMDADKYPAFIKWVYGRIAQLSSLLTERSQIFHQNVTGKEIQRHTPYEDQLVYLYGGNKYSIESRVLADVYHENYLRLADTEVVNYWQAITNPDEIQIKPVYMDTTGALDQPATATALTDVFGLIADRDALGYTICNQRTTSAAYNGEGEYQNFWMKWTDRYWNDFTENAIILFLD